MQSLPDVDIPHDSLARPRSGERSAQGQVCALIEPRSRRTATAKTGRLQEKMRVSDVSQSTFIDIVRSADQIPEDSTERLNAWGLKVLDNNLRDLVGFHNADRRDRDKEQAIESGGDLGVPGPGPSPVLSLVQGEDLARLALCIRELPVDDQRILQWFLRPGFSDEQAAEQLGRSIGATRILLARARAGLRTRLTSSAP